MTMPQYQRKGYGRFLIDFSKKNYHSHLHSIIMISYVHIYRTLPVYTLQHQLHHIFINVIALYEGSKRDTVLKIYMQV